MRIECWNINRSDNLWELPQSKPEIDCKILDSDHFFTVQCDLHSSDDILCIDDNNDYICEDAFKGITVTTKASERDLYLSIYGTIPNTYQDMKDSEPNLVITHRDILDHGFIARRFKLPVTAAQYLSDMEASIDNGLLSVKIPKIKTRRKTEQIINKLITVSNVSSVYKDSLGSQHLLNDDTNYWCSKDSNENAWVLFNVEKYKISKVEIVFYYACSKITVETSSYKNKNIKWTQLAAVNGLSKDTEIKEIKLFNKNKSFVKLTFSDCLKKYVGITNIKLWSMY